MAAAVAAEIDLSLFLCWCDFYPGQWSARVAAFVEGKFMKKTFELSISNQAAESMDNNMHNMNRSINNMNTTTGITNNFMSNWNYGSNNNRTLEDSLRAGAVLMGITAAIMFVYEGYR